MGMCVDWMCWVVVVMLSVIRILGIVSVMSGRVL